MIHRGLSEITITRYPTPGLLSQEQILEWFQWADAYWGYEGEPSPQKPHAELSSGLCSNGYFDCPRLLSYPEVAEVLGTEAAFRLRAMTNGRIDWVVSSAYSAITFGHEVAKALEARFANVEKDPADPAQKRMLWRRLSMPPDSKVLQAEELITTVGISDEVRRAVQEGNEAKNLIFLFPIVALVHRPPSLAEAALRRNIVALVEKEIWAVPPSECPLCKAGSPRFKPKTHWAELTGKR